MVRNFLLLALTVLAIAGLGWALWPRPIDVETARIARQAIEVSVEEEGKTRVREVFSVSAPVAGRMARLDLHAGDTVTANTTVVALMRPSAPALLDNRSRRIAQFRVDAAIAAVDLANAQLGQAEAQAGFLKAELDRAGVLMSRVTIAERTLEKARLDLATADAAILSARASLAVRKQELESARAELIEIEDLDPEGGCCVKVLAPVSGKVLRVLIESEQVVQAGTLLAELGNPDDIEIAVDLLSRDAVRIVPGAEAIIEGWGGIPLGAIVERIDPSAFTKVSALGIEEQRVTAILRPLGNPSEWKKLGHGFRVVARIAVSSRENVPAIPLGAIFRSSGNWAAYRVSKGRAERAVLELGIRNGDFAEIRSGLADGDEVILHPSDRVVDGTRVRQVPVSRTGG